MRAWTGLLAIVLLASGGALGALADDLRETPRTPPGPAALLGGFSALAVQVLSIRADAAAAEGDPAEALVHLDLILELEPQLIRGSDWIAHEIGVNMAGEEPDPAAAFGLVMEGLRVHDRCVGANPGDVDAILQRGNYVLRRFASSPERALSFEEALDRTPYAAALDDFRAALAMEPGDLEILDGIGVAALYAGRDALRDGDDSAAAALIIEAKSAFTESLAKYRAEGLESLPTKEWALGLATALDAVLAAPAAERPALYREFYRRYGGPEGLPGLPEPESR